MLNADTTPYLQWCPRCNLGAMEKLSTHSYCVNCNWHPEETNLESDSYYYPLDLQLSKQIEKVVEFLRQPALLESI